MTERIGPGRAAELVVDLLVREHGIDLCLGHLGVPPRISLNAFAALSRTRFFLLFISPTISEKGMTFRFPSSVNTARSSFDRNPAVILVQFDEDVADLRFRIFSSGSLR